MPRSLTRPSYHRISTESTHYDIHRHAFLSPLTVDPIGCSPGEEHHHFMSPSPALSPEDVHRFSSKDVAIYGNYLEDIPAKDRLDLYGAVYRAWFPHRCLEEDLSDGNFAATYLHVSQAPVRVENIVDFHGGVAQQLKACPDIVLRKSLPVVFILVEEDWRTNGVLLVWKTQGVAKRYGCREGEKMMQFRGGDGSGLGQAVIFRCELEEALKAVVAMDEKRVKARTEWNSVLEEVLGEE